jgi:hypothetical protein
MYGPKGSSWSPAHDVRDLVDAGSMGRRRMPAFLLRYLGRLRFPWLFGVTIVLFLVDLVIPDLVPWADEILLGLLTLLFGAWRKQRRDRDIETTNGE